MNLYPLLYRLILSRLPAEWVHLRALDLLETFSASPAVLKILESRYGSPPDPVNAFGLTFRNRLGLAAGMDKDGRAIPAWAALGFGFVEIGTVTPRPQPGNPTPRLFRLPSDQALINRMGFPGIGADAVASRLKQLRERFDAHYWIDFPIGISVGKNKNTPIEDAANDYRSVLNTLHDYGDFFVINVSSPNTPALRELQTSRYLEALLTEALSELRAHGSDEDVKPLLVKIAPDLSDDQIDQIVDLCLSTGVAGMIATNTTVDRSALTSAARGESGGLSGVPLRERSTQVIRRIADRAGSRLPVIGVGGIFTASDAQAKLDAGAVLLQGYTGFIYHGMGYAKSVVGGLNGSQRRS